jgi:hypothetical protein
MILDSKQSMLITDSDNRDYITTAKWISETDDSISSFLIRKRVNILIKWALKNNLEDDIVLATSDNYYSNDVLTFEWLKYFDVHSKKVQKETHRLLILNGYESHLMYKFFEYAKFKDIYLIKLSSHSIHLTQSLNVRMFQSFKHYHTKAINTTIRMSNSDFNRLNFLTAFHQFRAQVFRFHIIQSAWKKIGIISFNLEMMLSKIRARNLASRLGNRFSSLSFMNLMPCTLKKSKEVIKMS